MAREITSVSSLYTPGRLIEIQENADTNNALIDIIEEPLNEPEVEETMRFGGQDIVVNKRLGTEINATILYQHGDESKIFN